MNVVVMGDIGWKDLYHVGDEAMTEAAVTALRARGIDDITLIGGDPSVISDLHGVPAVRRFGFFASMTRERLEHRMHGLLAHLADPAANADRAAETVAAVADSDAIIIAGGGNMNSEHVNQLFERYALARVAKHFNRPLYVTSQTVGPLLREDDEYMVRTILENSTWFGARDQASADLVRTLGESPEKVVHTMDDAALLRPNDDDRRTVSTLAPSDRYVVASFTDDVGTSGLTRDEYCARLATMLDHLVVACNVDVVLAPHAGSFEPSTRRDDQLTHDAIVGASRSGRVSALDMCTARQLIALSEHAALSISTRYHPLVFGTAQSVPSAAISLSYYSSVRMRGALANIGLEPFVFPADMWLAGAVDEILVQLVNQPSPYREFVEPVSSDRLRSQRDWWDSIVASIAGRSQKTPPSLRPVRPFTSGVHWAQMLATITRSSDRADIATVYANRAASKGEAAEEASQRLAGEVVDTRERLRLNSERCKALEDEIIRLNEACQAQQWLTRTALDRLESQRRVNVRISSELTAERNRRSVRVANALGRTISIFRQDRH